MTFAQRIREAREQAGMTAVEAADQIGVSDRQLLRYEHGQSKVAPDIVLRMAEVYRKPELIIQYRQEKDLFEQELGAIELTNVNPDVVAGLVKFEEELEEAINATRNILRMIINHRVSKKDKQRMPELLEQIVYDVRTATTHVEVQLLALLGLEVGLEAHRRHEEKCIKKGYKTKKKPATQERVQVRLSYA
ncbi:MAG: helix-turn-helix transcriptional regulator [Thermoanaerobacteraceae bacterium]|nr:helix-turn-helix transcriptional regulator [Thermoanaerobacteraceae bacterium]